MRTYAAHLEALSPLEAFDPAAFVGDANYCQQQCDFVLSLAVAFNDFHDLLVAHDIFNAVWPSDETTVTPELGEFLGLTQHLFRLHLGTLHEVLTLVENNSKVLKEPSFIAVVKRMSTKAREAWDAIVGAALETGAQGDDLGKFLYFARNKVAFHYDRKEIASGFKQAFLENADREPYVSRGDSLARSRFYFGDASVQEYMRRKAAELGAPNSILTALEFMQSVTFALHQVVFTFIVGRGFAWRLPKTPPEFKGELQR